MSFFKKTSFRNPQFYSFLSKEKIFLVNKSIYKNIQKFVTKMDTINSGYSFMRKINKFIGQKYSK